MPGNSFLAQIIVISLNQEELATDEDTAYGIDRWVRLFKSNTWEGPKMVAQNDSFMTSTIESMYLSNADKNIIKVAREREDFLRSQAYKDKKIEALTSENESLSSENKSLSSENKSLTSEITRLRKLLEDNGIQP